MKTHHRLAMALGLSALLAMTWSGTAQAASQTVTYDCLADEPIANVSLAIGETLTISTTNGSYCTEAFYVSGAGVGSMVVDSGVSSPTPMPYFTMTTLTAGDDVVFTAVQPGIATFFVRFASASNPPLYLQATWRVTVTAPAVAAEPGSQPVDQVQQVGVPASGSCADVVDTDLKWGTELTGGWHPAWGEWANRMVCSRTFHYGASGWEIAA